MGLSSLFKLGLALAVIIALAGLFLYIYNKGEKSGKLSERVKVSEQSIIRSKAFDKTRQKNNSINDIELIERYCRWVYGSTYDECVSNYKPVDR